MARKKGLLPISANFEVGSAEPFDARAKVEFLSDLTNPITWGGLAYKGMDVNVTDDPTPDNNGKYLLKDDDFTNINNWEKVGSGSTSDDISNQSSVTGATVTEALNTLSNGVGAVAVDLIAHASDYSNPHSVTKEQVGLGNVDNTSDADKPVSTAAQLEIDRIDSNVANNSTAIDVNKDAIAALSGASMKLANDPSLVGTLIPTTETTLNFVTANPSDNAELLTSDETANTYVFKKKDTRYIYLTYAVIETKGGGDKTVTLSTKRVSDNSIVTTRNIVVEGGSNKIFHINAPVLIVDSTEDDLDQYITWSASDTEVELVSFETTISVQGAGGGEAKPDLVGRPRTGVTEVIDMNLNETTTINFTDQTAIDIQVTPPSDTSTKDTRRRVILNNLINPNAVNSITFNTNGGNVLYIFGDGDPINSLASGAKAVMELSNVGDGWIYVETIPTYIAI